MYLTSEGVIFFECDRLKTTHHSLVLHSCVISYCGNMLTNEETILDTFYTYHRACQLTEDLNLHKEDELSIEWIVFIQDFKSAKNGWS